MFHCISCVSFSASHDQLRYQSPQCLSMLGRKWKKTLILLQNNAENFCGSKRQQGLGKESELPWSFSFYSLPSFVPICLEQHSLKLTGFFPPLRQLHCPRQAHSRLDSLPCNSNSACILQVFASLAANSVVIQSTSSAFHMSENLNIFTNYVQSSGQMVSVGRFLLLLIIHGSLETMKLIQKPLELHYWLSKKNRPGTHFVSVLKYCQLLLVCLLWVSLPITSLMTSWWSSNW